MAPLKALVRERIKDWGQGFCKALNKRMVELTGDYTPDMVRQLLQLRAACMCAAGGAPALAYNVLLEKAEGYLVHNTWVCLCCPSHLACCSKRCWLLTSSSARLRSGTASPATGAAAATCAR